MVEVPRCCKRTLRRTSGAYLLLEASLVQLPRFAVAAAAAAFAVAAIAEAPSPVLFLLSAVAPVSVGGSAVL